MEISNVLLKFLEINFPTFNSINVSIKKIMLNVEENR